MKEDGKVSCIQLTPLSSAKPTIASANTAVGLIVHLPTTARYNVLTGRNLYQWHLFNEQTLNPSCELFEMDVLLTWMLDSMKPEISDQLIDYESVKDNWDAVIHIYSKMEDESRFAELNRKPMELQQKRGTS